jgi:Ca2+-binding RTX toxin-like protein
VQIRGAEALNDAMNGGAGTDQVKVVGAASAVLVKFNTATSSIETWTGNNQGLLGTAAANVFNFGALAAKTGLPFVDGAGGSDTIIGSKFADDLRGGGGSDTLTGGAGIDHIAGGANNDFIVFNAPLSAAKSRHHHPTAETSKLENSVMTNSAPPAH